MNAVIRDRDTVLGTHRFDLHLVEAGLFEHRLPARTGQPACDSTGPEVDVAECGVGDGIAVGDVGELQHSTGA